MRTPQPLPIQELFEKVHANGLSVDFLQKLQRRTNDTNGTFPSSLTKAAAAAAAAVQAATNTTEFLSHLHKQAEFDLIAKNHLDLYTENLLNANDNLRNNNEKLRNANLQNYHNNNNNNNNDTTLNDANKLNNTHIKHKTDGPKNTRNMESSRMQKLFQVSATQFVYSFSKREIQCNRVYLRLIGNCDVWCNRFQARERFVFGQIEMTIPFSSGPSIFGPNHQAAICSFSASKITRSAARINFDQFSYWNQSTVCCNNVWKINEKSNRTYTNTTNGNNR